jgi:hypothetical protein
MNRSQLSHNINLRLLLSATLISLALALFGYLFLFQTPSLAKREIAFTALLWLALTPLVYLLLFRSLIPRLNQYTPQARRIWLLLSIGVGILFTLVTRPPQLILFFPKHTLQVEIPPGSLDRRITLEYATTALRGDISFSQFSTSGNWQRTDSGFTLSGSEPASLSWSGRTGDTVTLHFSDTPALSEIRLGWDGNLSSLDTSQASNGQVPLSFTFQPGWKASAAARLLTGFTVGFLFLTLTLYLAGVELKAAKPVKHKKGYWLLYALPMIAIWGIYLLTFWPTLIGYDSITEWNYIVTGNYIDDIPVFYTLFVWLLTRIWFSPSIVAIFQILALSLTVAWGISLLDDQGLPRWAAWFLSALFALSPINGDNVIFFQKDAPYSLFLMLLSLIVLKLVFTDGKWINNWHNWVLFAFVMLGVSSFRHNGLPLAAIIPFLMMVIYRGFWRFFVLSLVLFFCIYYLIHVPVYHWLNVNPATGWKQQVWEHKIAAHYVNGDPFTLKEQSLYNKIFPGEELKYDCCNILVTTSQSRIIANPSATFNLLLSLTLKEPKIEIKHQLCASSMIWEIPSRCQISMMMPRSEGYWVNKYIPYFKENSFLPFLAPFLARLLISLEKNPYLYFIINPSIFFYFGLFCIFFASLRMRRLNILFYYFPSVIQTGILLLINVAPRFRYQYGVYLTSLFSLGLLILALTTPRNKQPGLINHSKTEE